MFHKRYQCTRKLRYLSNHDTKILFETKKNFRVKLRYITRAVTVLLSDSDIRTCSS